MKVRPQFLKSQFLKLFAEQEKLKLLQFHEKYKQNTQNVIYWTWVGSL